MDSKEETAKPTVQELPDIRQSLLRLHKVLLDFERETYERAHDRIESSYQFLNLVMNDPWFAWLRNLSELIVLMDEMLAGDEPPTEVQAQEAIEQSRELIAPSEGSGEFQRKYFKALQESPDVVLAHSQTAKLLGPGKVGN
jgi:hypothetical protein